MIPVTLVTERLVLDTPTADDRERVAEYCTDPLFERFLTTPWPYQQKDADYFLGTLVPEGWNTGGELTWAIRERTDGPLLGVIGHRTALQDVGFWLGAPHRGKGYMPETVTAVADWLFSRGLASLNWECVPGNEASVSVARTVGFTFTGTAPATIAYRDGSHPDSWHAVLRATDPRDEKPGWPV